MKVVGGSTVEIDELCFTKRNYNVGRDYLQKWGIDNVSRETKKCVLFTVQDKTAETLLSRRYFETKYLLGTIRFMENILRNIKFYWSLQQ